MNFINFIKNVTTILFSVLCLIGCSGKTEIESFHVSKAPTHVKNAKPGALIKLASTSIVFSNANEEIATEIILEVGEPSGILDIQLSPAKGLNLVDTVAHQTINFTSSAPIKIPINVIAMANGRYYLNLHVGLNNGDFTSIRNLALIVQVGPEADKSVQFKKTAGENVISLPAQESISAQ